MIDILIKQDSFKARKERDVEKALFLTTVLGEIDNEKKRNKNFDQASIIATLQKFRKTAREVVKLTEGDARKAAEQEIAWIEEYLPKQCSYEELKLRIEEIINNEENVHIGHIMKTLMSDHSLHFDGKVASSLAQELLNKEK